MKKWTSFGDTLIALEQPYKILSHMNDYNYFYSLLIKAVKIPFNRFNPYYKRIIRLEKIINKL
jgi:hypothetical protein